MNRLFFSLALTLSLAVPAAAADRPNILFAIADDHGWPHCGAYGTSGVRTPAIDHVARAGILFTRAHTASPGCSPSRASILTGRPTWQLREAGTHASSFPRDLTVYPDLLEKEGYVIGLTGKGWGPGNFKISGWERNPAGPKAPTRTLANAPDGVSKTDYAAEFAAFLADRPKGKPFCFWYGGSEPHRAYAKGAGLKAGKKLEDAPVPPFLPDTPEVRSDILDYLVEIEHFDSHLARMLDLIEKAGERDNTLVVVTGDNGMPFPRAKANLYDAGTHVPLAICWPARFQGQRTVEDPVSLSDLAPTFLEAAGVKPPEGMVARSLLPLLTSNKSGRVDPDRDRVFTARERHSSSRVKNLGYPCRAVITADYLYIRNFAPDRWPAGDPRDSAGKVGFFDIDGSPSKSLLVEDRTHARFLDLATAKRPAEELFDLKTDPGNLVNLAGKKEHEATRKKLSDMLEAHLRATGDPHLAGKGDIFETYPRYSPIRKFPGDE